MRLVLISDTHEQHEQVKLSEGDVLIHAGDYTFSGVPKVKQKFFKWLADLPFKHKLVIAGNHDFGEPEFPVKLEGGVQYLYESESVIEGVRFWGSPWTPLFGQWAFMYDRAEGFNMWSGIPANVDVLITHGPPLGFRDRVAGWGEQVGCYDLREAVLKLKPKLHVFGHIHGSYGQEEFLDTHFINASVCNEAYAPVNAPIVFDLS